MHILHGYITGSQSMWWWGGGHPASLYYRTMIIYIVGIKQAPGVALATCGHIGFVHTSTSITWSDVSAYMNGFCMYCTTEETKDH